MSSVKKQKTTDEKNERRTQISEIIPVLNTFVADGNGSDVLLNSIPIMSGSEQSLTYKVALSMLEASKFALENHGRERVNDIKDASDQHEAEILMRYSNRIPAVPDVQGNPFNPPTAGVPAHFEVSTENLENSIHIYENRLVVLKYEIFRRKSLHEREALKIILDYTLEKAPHTTFDSQEF